MDHRWVAEQLRLAVLAASDRLFGLEVEHLSVDGCITKAPCGGQVAGPSPVDRRKQGLKRSVATETGGIPLAAVAAPANRRDDGLLAATLGAVTVIGPLPKRPTVHLDAGYDYQPRRAVLAHGHGRPDRHARRAGTGPGGRRWVIERTHAGQPVRQALLLHRTLLASGRVLAGAGPCGHYPGSPDPPCLDPLPLGRPSRRRP
jgi:hypothetical protein